MDALMNRAGFRVSVCGQEEIEQLSRDGSHYSLSTGILPSLGARSSRRIKLRRFILSPYDRRYRCTVFYFLGFCFWASFYFVCIYVLSFPRFFYNTFFSFVCVCVFVLYIHIWMNDYIVLLPSCFWICTGFVLFFFNTLIVKARIWIQEVSLGNKKKKKKKKINGASWFVKFLLVTDLLSFEFTNLFLLF